MQKSKRRKRKMQNQKVGLVVSLAGGVEQNLKMIQVGNQPQRNPPNSLYFTELDLQKVWSPDEKKKLYDAIGYDGEDTSTLSYPKEVSLGGLFNEMYF